MESLVKLILAGRITSLDLGCKETIQLGHFESVGPTASITLNTTNLQTEDQVTTLLAQAQEALQQLWKVEAAKEIDEVIRRRETVKSQEAVLLAQYYGSQLP